MKAFHAAALTAALCLGSAFTSVEAQQGPPEQEEEHGRPRQPEERQEQDRPQPGQESRQQPQPQSRPEPAQQPQRQSRPDSPRQSQETPEPQQRPGNVRPDRDRSDDDNGRGSQSPSAQRPPADFTEARRIIQQNRHSIGRGSTVASRVRVVKGQRLPSGWGKRLTPEQLRPLPKYPGYEWRRLGSDMILVDAKTVIVVEILSGVLD